MLMTNISALAADTANQVNTIGDLFSLSTGGLNMTALLLCTACSLVLGAMIAFTFGRGEKKSKGFSLTLIVLPAIVQMVIMLVNGNVGTGVAVMGAFGLVKFRSAPGSAKEICAIFLSMAAGLACGTQHLSVAFIYTLLICIISFVISAVGNNGSSDEKCLKIVIPESLDYGSVFNDLFEKYTVSCELDEVKTTNMGSLYKLTYTTVLKDAEQEKAFLDELRERNGNLEISCGRPVTKTNSL